MTWDGLEGHMKFTRLPVDVARRAMIAGGQEVHKFTPLPVGAGPRFFFAITVCFFIKTVIA